MVAILILVLPGCLGHPVYHYSLHVTPFLYQRDDLNVVKGFVITS